MSTIAEAVTARAGAEASAVADEINRTLFKVTRPVVARAVKKMWTERMILARCWVIAHTPEVAFEARVFCRATYDALTGDTFADFDPSDREQRAKMDQYFAALIQAGAMTEQDRVDTLALGEVELTGAALHGRPLDESDVINLRAEKV